MGRKKLKEKKARKRRERLKARRRPKRPRYMGNFCVAKTIGWSLVRQLALIQIARMTVEDTLPPIPEVEDTQETVITPTYPLPRNKCKLCDVLSLRWVITNDLPDDYHHKHKLYVGEIDQPDLVLRFICAEPLVIEGRVFRLGWEMPACRSCASWYEKYHCCDEIPTEIFPISPEWWEAAEPEHPNEALVPLLLDDVVPEKVKALIRDLLGKDETYLYKGSE